MPDVPDKPLLSTGEFAAAIGVERRTATEWCRKNKIDHITTPGGDYRIPRTEALRILGQIPLPEN